MKIEFKPNSYMDITFKMMKNAFFKKVFFMPGIMLYGYNKPERFIFKALEALPYVMFSLIILTSGPVAITSPERYDSIAVVLFAICYLTYLVKKKRLHIKRTEQADEMLSMWLIKNYPNMEVNSKELLNGATITKDNKFFILVITKEKAEIYVFEDPNITGESSAEAQPIAVHLLENKM